MESDKMVRTQIHDAILATVSARLDDAEVRAVGDVAFTATEMACRSNGSLLDFDDWQEVRL